MLRAALIEAAHGAARSKGMFLGDHFVQELEHERIKQQAGRRLERLGYQVSLEPTQEVA